MSRFHKIFMDELGTDLYNDLLHWVRTPRRQLRGSFSFYVANHHMYREVEAMPRKRKETTNGTSTTNNTPSTPVTWINIRFEGDEVQWVTELADNANQIGTQLASLLIDGQSFSVKQNPARGNYSAFVVGLVDPTTGTHCAVSAYAPSAIAATAAVLAKVALWKAEPSRASVAGNGMGIG